VSNVVGGKPEGVRLLRPEPPLPEKDRSIPHPWKTFSDDGGRKSPFVQWIKSELEPETMLRALFLSRNELASNCRREYLDHKSFLKTGDLISRSSKYPEMIQRT